MSLSNKKTIFMMMIILGCCLAFLASGIGLDKLSSFTDNSDYPLSRLDLFQIIFVPDDMKNYPYLSKSDINLLLLPVTYYFTGLIISSSSFLLKEKGYFNFIYARLGSKARAVAWMKRPGLKMSVCFFIVYNVMLYIISHKCFLKGLPIQEGQLIGYLILHTINSILAIVFLQEITFQVYCRKGVAPAFLIGAVMMIILMVMDMALTSINILMFNKELYFVDGIIINIFLYVWIRYRKKNRLMQLPY